MIDENTKIRIKPGATIRVYEKVKDGTSERVSQLQGIVIARKHGSEPGATFTLRTNVAQVGMEKIYPIHSPLIEKVVILGSPKKVHRAKLYYLRELSKKEIRKQIITSASEKTAN